MTEAGLRNRIKRVVEREYRSMREAGKVFGMSGSYLALILAGERPITAKIAKKFGYREIPQGRKFQRIKEAK